ncbi:spore germination lipoprotein GerD [Tepidibacillus sp. LV47]|uniref:spore germination lipoprotein GerD n=1 Tax=Tepidibacillus sp. LV47 TaxID=3398228 RepID=UPI003AAC8898
MKKKMIVQLFLLMFFISIFFSGCNAVKSPSSSPDYKEMKQMVIDILQTEEGKKAIKEAAGQKLQSNEKKLAIGDEVKKIVQDEFLSSNNTMILKEMYQDPKFTSQLAKILKKENKNLMKDLMKDPEYRKMLLEVMNDPEYQKLVLELLKSNTYRKQMMMVIKESLESPLFQEDLLKLMKKANEEALKPEEKGKEDKEEQKGKKSQQGGTK